MPTPLRISNLPTAAVWTPTDLVAVVQSGTTKHQTATAGPQLITWLWNGIVPPNQILVDNILPYACTIPIAFAGSVGCLRVPTTAQKDFDVQKNGVSFGTLRFAAAASLVTLISAAGASFNGTTDKLTVIGPATPDVTLAGFGATIVVVRS